METTSRDLHPVQFFLVLVALLLPPGKATAQDQPAASWTPTGSMHTDRYGHTATLLPADKVLVTGGYSLHCILAP